MITDAVGHIRDVQSALVYGASLGLDLREIPDNPMPDLQRAPRTQAATRPPARPPPVDAHMCPRTRTTRVVTYPRTAGHR